MDQCGIVLIDFYFYGFFGDDGAGGKEVRNVSFFVDSRFDLLDLALVNYTDTGAALFAYLIRLSLRRQVSLRLRFTGTNLRMLEPEH